MRRESRGVTFATFCHPEHSEGSLRIILRAAWAGCSERLFVAAAPQNDRPRVSQRLRYSSTSSLILLRLRLAEDERPRVALEVIAELPHRARRRAYLAQASRQLVKRLGVWVDERFDVSDRPFRPFHRFACLFRSE